jgi:hypothetical protein
MSTPFKREDYLPPLVRNSAWRLYAPRTVVMLAASADRCYGFGDLRRSFGLVERAVSDSKCMREAARLARVDTDSYFWRVNETGTGAAFMPSSYRLNVLSILSSLSRRITPSWT